jgi:UDP:flavonoid glycosyltransferase YjiC (YdhE family)
VLVTQGTYNIDPTDLVEPTLRALADADALVLATTARARLGTAAPENARIADFLNFDDVLPLVDVAITNGGWGGVLHALSHGIPLLVAGGDLDKPEIAARVAWSGAGVDLGTGKPSERQIASALARILAEPRFAERARSIATQLRELGGPSKTVDLIEELDRTREPVRRASSPWG